MVVIIISSVISEFLNMVRSVCCCELKVMPEYSSLDSLVSFVEDKVDEYSSFVFEEVVLAIYIFQDIYTLIH